MISPIMESLPKPTILENYVEREFQPPMPAWRLRWETSQGTTERRWYLPRHLTLTGPAPERFGLTITRNDSDSYAASVIWDDMKLNWNDLSRVQILTCAFTPLLRALGQDIWQLLNRPIDRAASHPAHVA
jgi:hypothetical protein